MGPLVVPIPPLVRILPGERTITTPEYAEIPLVNVTLPLLVRFSEEKAVGQKFEILPVLFIVTMLATGVIDPLFTAVFKEILLLLVAFIEFAVTVPDPEMSPAVA